jgi:D-hexose-6-phosphate mutarotase
LLLLLLLRHVLPMVVNVQVDAVLWNPWEKKASTMSDLDTFRTFVCIEPGLVSKQYSVEQGSELQLSQTITPH